MPHQMRAVRLKTAASGELEVAAMPIPQPATNEVLIRVCRAGVNSSDAIGARLGINRFTGGPLTEGEIIGGEVAGVRQDTGQRVVAVCGVGGYAEWAIAPESLTFAIPDAVADDAALALFVSGLTAWFLYRPLARMSGGETVVVPGAAGALGSIALQLGKMMGAGRVIATASSEAKRAAALEYGADAAVDGAPGGLGARLIEANSGRPVDVVFDMAAGETFAEALGALAPFGRVIVYGHASGQPGRMETTKLVMGSRSISGLWLVDFLRAGLAAEPLQELFELYQRGDLHIEVGPTYPLADASRAQHDLIGRTTSGKVLLDVTA